MSPSKSSEQPGRFCRFYCQELINSGGMADIWLATDQRNKSFALRRLHDDLNSTSRPRKRFVRGCEILAKIHNHEFVIGYVDMARSTAPCIC